MSTPAIVNFMRQQGFTDESEPACDMHFAGLYFQPRIVFPLVLLATVFGLSGLFLALSACLWWNALVPRLNPFEALYNRFWARHSGRSSLAPAPAPRRFAQGMAAAFTLGAALALLLGQIVLARIFEAFLIVAFAALLFGRFCLGAYVYHLLRGRVTFANSTLPWAKS